jgi:uncharacterized protein YgiM (DUF1202 family)
MRKKQITVIVISLIVISAAIGFSACASGALAGPKSGIESQVQTAAAATVVQYMIETQVAVQSLAMASAPVAQVQVTEPPAPTPTQIPTKSAEPTVAATVEPVSPTSTPTSAASPTPAALSVAASSPKIVADQNTNCRVGPGTGYTIATVFMKGSESSVKGRNDAKNWWYIANPNSSSESCWVWEGSTTVVGDTSTLDVVEAPAIGYPKASNTYYGSYYCDNPYVFCTGIYDDYGCGNYPYNYWKLCNPDKWKKCNTNVYCNCTPVCKNPCKKSNCPPVTIVNYKKYCKNYPQCCGNGENNLTGN